MKETDRESPLPTKLQHTLREGTIWLINKLYPNRLAGPEDERNLHTLRQKIEAGSSAVVMFNHGFIGDPYVAVASVFRTLGTDVPVWGPAAKKYHDILRYPMQAAVLYLTSGPLGVNIVPLIQHYDRESYSEQEIRRNLREFVAAAKEMLNQAGSVLFISPEGTRSEDGTLQRAQPGIEHFSSYGSSVWYLPLGIIQEVKSRGYGFGGTVVVRAGEPFESSSIRQDEIPDGLTIADAMMLKVAALLPEDMRGVYAPYVRT